MYRCTSVPRLAQPEYRNGPLVLDSLVEILRPSSSDGLRRTAPMIR